MKSDSEHASDLASNEGKNTNRSNRSKTKNLEDVKNQITYKTEPTTNNLIMKMMEFISKEEKLAMGATGKKAMLSSKEKNRLIKDFLDLRAAPYKNRFFQQKKAETEDILSFRAKQKAAAERRRILELETRAAVIRPIAEEQTSAVNSDSNTQKGSRANLQTKDSAAIIKVSNQDPESPSLKALRLSSPQEQSPEAEHASQSQVNLTGQKPELVNSGTKMGSGSNLLTLPNQNSMTLKDNKQLENSKQFILKKSVDEEWGGDNRSLNSFGKPGPDAGRARNSNLGQIKTHQQ